jgi:hypothetical protein
MAALISPERLEKPRAAYFSSASFMVSAGKDTVIFSVFIMDRDSDYSVSLWQYFAIQSLEEMLYLEFMEMVKRGIRIKRCALCDRYFVLADKRRRDYCDRIYKGKRTCKQIGAKQKFNESVEQDSFLQEFQRVYNRCTRGITVWMLWIAMSLRTK